MKLIVLTKQFGNYTGATISTIEILKRISLKFDKVIVITLKAENIHIANVVVDVAQNYIDLIKKVKKVSLDDVIGYSDDHLGFIYSFFNIKYVHTYHGNWPDAKYLNKRMYVKSFYFIPLYKLTIKKASFVISVSKYMQEKFVNKFNKRNCVIFNGIKQNNTSFEENNIKRKDQESKFLMVGNIDKRKYKNAIKVFDLLQNDHFNKSIDIYGSLIDRSVVSRLKAYKFVNIKGMVKRIDYQSYTAMICTSASENLPVSIVEAIINKVPVVSFDVGGIPEVIQDTKNGYLFSLNDYSKFARKIENFNNINIPIENIHYVKEAFNWDNSAQKYYQIFWQVMENKF